MTADEIYDLAIVGGGINGAGIACDAAGRGLKVLLCEANDLGGATSSASSKMIHGGLRYLEHYEFRLVRESLKEREVMLAKAPHIVWPMRFVLPHAPGMRPAWMLRLGLFLYDHLYRRQVIPGSGGLRLDSGALDSAFSRGFSYWDCWVDDARLVVLNARQAADLGARVETRSRVIGGVREQGVWRIDGIRDNQNWQARAKVVVNAAGPWAGRMLRRFHDDSGEASQPTVRRVKGSHIVVPRVAGAEDGYLFQNDDGRVIFMLPYEGRFTLIGTTDVPDEGDPADVDVSAAEEDYLIAAVNRYLRSPLDRDDIVWRYAGVRPLLNEDVDNPSEVSRDYHLELDGAPGEPPLLSVFGGKITTYRCLAEECLAMLRPFLPNMTAPWTASTALPGGDLDGLDFDAFVDDQARRRPKFELPWLRALARRHGSRIEEILDGAASPDDLGPKLGGGLTTREVTYLRDNEWARTPNDVLWRRTKVGLHLTPVQRDGASRAIEEILG